MAKINWTNEAEKWLRDIHRHIAQDNLSAAERVVTGIYRKAQILADFPEIGYKYRTEPDGDIRILLYGHYRIAYLIKESDQIDILGVFHGALDIDKYFP
jgi:plasmid stabilization system protein ParE